jgi:hypothetical protein
MHRRGAGIAAALFACVVATQSVSAALLTLDDVTLPGDPVVVVNGVSDADGALTGVGGGGTEGAAQAIDNTTTKYLNFADYGSGFIVTPRVGPSLVRGIRLYTANDAPERDPASFVLEGAQSPDGPFTVIYASNITLPGQGPGPADGPTNGRNPSGQTINPNVHDYAEVLFPNGTNYASYRVTFPTLRDGLQANAMQIGEVELLGTIIPEPATLGLLSIGALALLRRRR